MADDGGLSRSGFDQAEKLVREIEPGGLLPQPTILLASPKKRARQTLHPVAAALGLAVVVKSVLDERRTGETGDAFRERIKAWSEMMVKELAADDVVWACTHMDWLEEAMLLLPSDLSELEIASGFSPAECQIFSIEDGFWRAEARTRI